MSSLASQTNLRWFILLLVPCSLLMFVCRIEASGAEISKGRFLEFAQSAAPTAKRGDSSAGDQTEQLVEREELQERREAYHAIARDIEDLRERNDISEALRERTLEEIGTLFWERTATARAANDHDRETGDAKIVVLALQPFWVRAHTGQISARDAHDELALLAEAYMMLNEPNSAFDVYALLFSVDRRDAEAAIGKAKAAEARKRDDLALEAWTQAQVVLTPRDPEWFEARYKIAKIQADRGQVADACDLLTRTEIDHPDLGSPDIRTEWQSLQHRLVCP